MILITIKPTLWGGPGQGRGREGGSAPLGAAEKRAGRSMLPWAEVLSESQNNNGARSEDGGDPSGGWCLL